MSSSSIENRLDRIEKSLVHKTDKADIERLESNVLGQRIREDDEEYVYTCERAHVTTYERKSSIFLVFLALQG